MDKSELDLIESLLKNFKEARQWNCREECGRCSARERCGAFALMEKAKKVLKENGRSTPSI